MMKKRRNIMQNDSIDNLRLDMNKKSVRGVIYVRAGDTRARTVHITLTSNGTVLDLSDAHICEILIRKPDGGMNDQAVDMNEQAMVRYGNELQYTFRTTDINVPGECKCQVMITFNDGAVITSPEFSVMVYQKTIDQNLEKSTNEYTAITQQLTEATELRNQTAQDADRAETAREGVENYEEICRQYSESASDSASNAALSEDAASQSAYSASADKELTKEYRDDAETFMEETRTNLAAVEEKATEILNYDSSAKESAESAAASATSASGSATSAAASAASVEDIKEDSEAYAAGTRNGSPVTSTDPAYNNNSKYYSEQAAQSAASFPTKLSGFTNDCGFIDKTVNDLVNYYTKNQTFTKAEVNALIAAINEFNIEFVQVLPSSGIDTHTFYFLAKQTPEQNDYYDEYVNTNGTAAGWEKIGSTQVDLSQYYTKTEVDNIIAGIGSGHEIVDGSGTTLTQEDALQFPDSFLSDDPTNGRTIVENIKEHTTASDYENATEDGIHVIDDGNDVPIGEIEEDVVSVTADGNKTYATLLDELYALIDSTKLTNNSYIDIFDGYFRLNDMSGGSYYFERAFSGAKLFDDTLQVSSSGSLIRSWETTTNGNTYSDSASTEKPANGTKITLYYGTSSTVINLKTDANYCQYDENTTVKQAIDGRIIGAMRAEMEVTIPGGGDVGFTLNDLATHLNINAGRIKAVCFEGARPKVSWTEVTPITYYNESFNVWGVHNLGTGGYAIIDILCFVTV
jgi:hypothetical protein